MNVNSKYNKDSLLDYISSLKNSLKKYISKYKKATTLSDDS